MKANVITLYEGHHHLGVAALINSLVACGFSGTVSIYHRGELPPWTTALNQVAKNTYALASCRIVFTLADARRHLGYHKPFAALDEFVRDADCDYVAYADPDVLFLAPWSFFEDWFAMGLAACQDFCFPYVSENHPWRKVWRDLLARAGLEVTSPGALYPNCGFFGVARNDIDFLHQWASITKRFEEAGGDTSRLDQLHRHQAIVSDQDLLAASLMGWRGKVSMLGLEGMGFSGLYFVLSHNHGSLKPWKKSFVKQSLQGTKPSYGDALYLKYANGPLCPFTSSELWRKQADYRVAQLISRVWSR